MAIAIPLMAAGAALIVAGCLIAVNAKKIAASAEREFYGPVTPTATTRERDRLMLRQLGGSPVLMSLTGAALTFIGVVLEVAGINLAAGGL